MTHTKSLPVLFAAVIALASGTAVATAQNAPADGTNAARAASAQVMNAEFGGHGKHGRGHGFGGRGGSGMMQQIFTRMDSDGNGAITQEEVDTFRAAQVAAADASGDGALSIDEFDTAYRDLTRSKMVRAFQRLDADGDGSISAAEMDAQIGTLVERMDRNGDGALSMEDRRGGRGRDSSPNKNCRGGNRS